MSNVDLTPISGLSSFYGWTHALFFEMKFFLRRTRWAGYKTDDDDEILSGHTCSVNRGN